MKAKQQNVHRTVYSCVLTAFYYWTNISSHFVWWVVWCTTVTDESDAWAKVGQKWDAQWCGTNEQEAIDFEYLQISAVTLIVLHPSWKKHTAVSRQNSIL